MRRPIRWLFAPLALVLASSALEAQAKLPNDSLELARKWSQWFLAGRADSIASKMSAEVLAGHGGLGGIIDAQAMVAGRAGAEKTLREERFVWRNGRRQYWRQMDMTVLPEPFLLRFVMSETGMIEGIGLGPVSQAPPTDSVGPVIKP